MWCNMIHQNPEKRDCVSPVAVLDCDTTSSRPRSWTYIVTMVRIENIVSIVVVAGVERSEEGPKNKK